MAEGPPMVGTQPAIEVVEAVQRGEPDTLREELGDLLLQVVYHARMAEEAGHFALPDVVRAISVPDAASSSCTVAPRIGRTPVALKSSP